MNILSNIWARVTSATKYIVGPLRSFWYKGSVSVNETTAMKVAAYHRGLVYISTQIAKLPWNIKDKKHNILDNDRISILLNLAPNNWINAFTFKVWMIQQAIHHGNSYCEIERDNLGRPLALWPLEYDRMCPYISPNGELFYEYSDPSNGTIYLQTRDVFHIKNFHLTAGGLLGQGLLAFAADVIANQIAADDMASGIFHNGGLPSGVLENPNKMSDAAYKRLKESWNSQNVGKKSGGTALLEEGTKFSPIKIEPDTLQFLESRQFGIIEIARFLGLPATKFFDPTASTYSNVENSNLEVATDTLHAWTTNLELEADVKLLSYRHAGKYSDIDLDYIFRGDSKSRSDYYKAMMSVAAITPNQIREREGLSSYEGGDEYYVATNNLTPVRRMDEIIDADIKQKEKSAEPPKPAKPVEPSPEEKAALEAATSYLLGK